MELNKEQQQQLQQALQTVRTLLGNRIMPDNRSTTDQLNDLVYVANQLGLYDAADAIQRMVKK